MSHNATDRNAMDQASSQTTQNKTFARSLDHHVLIADARRERSIAAREAVLWLSRRILGLSSASRMKPALPDARNAAGHGPSTAACA